MVLADASFGDRPLEPEHLSMVENFLVVVVVGPLPPCEFSLSAHILPLRFSNPGTSFGHYSHSFVFIPQPSFVPNG